MASMSRFRLERGSDEAAPLARVDGLEPDNAYLSGSRNGRPPFWERRGSDASRPRPVGGVNELVKYADIDAR